MDLCIPFHIEIMYIALIKRNIVVCSGEKENSSHKVSYIILIYTDRITDLKDECNLEWTVMQYRRHVKQLLLKKIKFVIRYG